jgi:uncharacterized protein (DUF58 family)
MIRPTRRLISLAALSLPLSVALVWFNESLWVLAVLFPAALMVLAAADAPSWGVRRGLTAAVKPATTPFYIDEPNAIDVTLTAGKGAAGKRFTILLELDGPATAPSAAAIADASGIARANIPVQVARRGEIACPALWVRWTSPLRLNTHVVRLPINLTVPAIPNIAAVRRAAILHARQGAVFGIKPQDQQGDGSDFDSLREYRPGMNLRAIDWKHSARHLQLVSKEFRIEQNHHVVIALDTGYLMREPMAGVAKLDRAINASLILAYQALAEGDRVALFAFDAQVRLSRPPVSGVKAFPKIQQAFSGLDYSAEETNFTLGLTALMAALNRRALVVILTDFVDTIQAEIMIENVQRLAKRHLVMFVPLKDVALEGLAAQTPASLVDAAKSMTAIDMLRERRVVLERLLRFGVNAFEADPQKFDSALVSRYLAVKRRELI